MLKTLFNDKSEYLAKVDHDYAVRGDIEDIGRIATNSTQELGGERSPEKSKKRRLEDQIIRMTNDFYNNMANWSLMDFRANNVAYRGWLNEQAQIAYENGNIEKGNSLSEIAHEFFEKEQAILNDTTLDENQQKEALKELWKDQNQEIIEEFIVQYSGQTSEVVINKKTNFDNQVEDVNHAKIESNEITIPGIKL